MHLCQSRIAGKNAAMQSRAISRKKSSSEGLHAEQAASVDRKSGANGEQQESSSDTEEATATNPAVKPPIASPLHRKATPMELRVNPGASS